MMNLLLDTHLLLWAAATPARLSNAASTMIQNRDNRLYFSAVSIWEITIKTELGRTDFRIDPALLRRGLVENDTRIHSTGCWLPRLVLKACCC
jgi:PIN domain nuclease of toxin-antitoxin system